MRNVRTGGRIKSEWTKESILSNVKKCYGSSAYEKCKGLCLSELRDAFLNYDGWHHTSSYFNSTPFYSFNDDGVDVSALHHIKIVPQKKVVEKKYCVVGYTDWEGTRNHPKPVPRTGVASYSLTNGKPSMVLIDGCWHKDSENKRFDSVNIIEELKGYPRSNSKIWKTLKR